MNRLVKLDGREGGRVGRLPPGDWGPAEETEEDKELLRGALNYVDLPSIA
jgi:hypothetical protein